MTARPAPVSGAVTSPGDAYSVLFVVTSLHGGGAEYVGREWMRWLASQGHRVSVVTTSSKPTPGFTPAGVAAASIGHKRGHVARVGRLRALVEAASPDVIVGMQSYPNLLLLAGNALLPRATRPVAVVSERNLVALGLAGSGPTHRIKHWLARRTYRLADHVIAVSHPVAGELVSSFGIPGAKVSVVPNPSTTKLAGRRRAASTDAPRAQADAVADATANATAPATANATDTAPDAAGVTPTTESAAFDIEIVLPSRVVAQKRPLLAVETASALKSRGIRTKIVLFGSGRAGTDPLLHDVLALAEREGIPVDIRGWSETWCFECSPSSVVLLPSLREGFGNVLVEAAGAGLASVAISSALGVADALVPGLTGELALDDHPETVADAVVAASKLTVPPMTGWLDHFSYESSGAALDHVLSRVLSQRRAS